MILIGRSLFTIFTTTVLGILLAQNGAGTPHSHQPPRLRSRFGLESEPGRIINGTLATMEATRHQVSLRRRLNDGYFFGAGHICGGALIRPNVVLGAAHCFVDQVIYNGTFLPKEDFIIVMGTLDRYERTNQTLIYDIEDLVFQLTEFDLSTYDKDIALMFLSGAVPPNYPTVRPIEMTSLAVAPDTVCQVTGWGLTEEGYNSDVLMTLDVPIMSDETCKTETNISPSLIKPGMLCAGYLEGEKDACSGDSGGPLVCNSKLSGIVSWGIKCAMPKLPGVYTEVAYYHEWVERQIKKHEGEGSGSGDEGSGSGDEGSGSGDEGSGSGDDGSGSGDDGSGSGDEGGGDDGHDNGGAMSSIISSFSLLSLVPIALSLSNC